MAINPRYIGVIGDSKTNQSGAGPANIAAALKAKGWTDADIRVSGVVSRPPWAGDFHPTAAETWADWQANGFDPKVVVINLGGNGKTAGAATWQSWFGQLYDMIEAPGRIIYWQNLAYQDPSVGTALNDWMVNTFLPSRSSAAYRNLIDFKALIVARQAASQQIDWYTDGVHMLNTTLGYGLPNGQMADAVAANAPSPTPPSPVDYADSAETEVFTGMAGVGMMALGTVFQSINGTAPIRRASTFTPDVLAGGSFSEHALSTSSSWQRTSLTMPTGAYGYVYVLDTLGSSTTALHSGIRESGSYKSIVYTDNTGVIGVRESSTIKATSGSPLTLGRPYHVSHQWRADTDKYRVVVTDLTDGSTVLDTGELTLTVSLLTTQVTEIILGSTVTSGPKFRVSRFERSTEYKPVAPPRQFGSGYPDAGGDVSLVDATVAPVTFTGDVSVPVAAAVSSSATRSGVAASSVAVSVAVSASAGVVRGAAATVGAAAAVTASASRAASGSTTVPAAAAVTSAATRVAAGDASVPVVAAVSSSGSRGATGATTMPVAAAVSSDAARVAASDTSLTATGTVAAAAVNNAAAAATAAATATVNGSVARTANTATAVPVAAVVSSAATVSSASSSDVTVTGAAQVTAAGSVVARGAASVPATANITTAARKGASAAATTTVTASVTIDTNRAANSATGVGVAATITASASVSGAAGADTTTATAATITVTAARAAAATATANVAAQITAAAAASPAATTTNTTTAAITSTASVVKTATATTAAAATITAAADTGSLPPMDSITAKVRGPRLTGRVLHTATLTGVQ